MHQFQIVANAQARVGEGPVWDRGAQTLHWVDILAGQIHSSDLATRRTTTLTVPTLVGAVAPRATGGFVAATAEGFAEVTTRGDMRDRVKILPDGVRMNDAKCDSRGRFWAGSTAMDFAPGRGALHLLDTDWTSRIVLDDLTLPNGLGWSPDDRIFYLIDSAEGVLAAFDFDPASAALSNRRTLAEYADDGVPDGLTVDASGCLWVALWGGGRIERLSPEGRLLSTVPVPVSQPTSCAFAGPDLDRLCVTSAREGLGLSADDDTLDGAVFLVDDLGASGLEMMAFAG